jgi:hypothetical protein
MFHNQGWNVQLYWCHKNSVVLDSHLFIQLCSAMHNMMYNFKIV